MAARRHPLHVHVEAIMFFLQDLQSCLFHAHEPTELGALKKKSILQVRDALARKVSRERMGVELEKMFTGESLQLCLPQNSLARQPQVLTAFCLHCLLPFR